MRSLPLSLRWVENQIRASTTWLFLATSVLANLITFDGTFLLSKPFGSGKLGEDEGHKDLTGLQYFKMPVAILRSHIYNSTAIMCVMTKSLYGTALMQRRTRSKHFARRTLALDVYHLDSSSLQLKNRSTIGLQQKLHKARLFNLKTICYKAFHRFKYSPSRLLMFL